MNTDVLPVSFQLNMTELRTFPNPPAIVTNVTAAVLVLLSPSGKIPKDRSWKTTKMYMSKVTGDRAFVNGQQASKICLYSSVELFATGVWNGV